MTGGWLINVDYIVLPTSKMVMIFVEFWLSKVVIFVLDFGYPKCVCCFLFWLSQMVMWRGFHKQKLEI